MAYDASQESFMNMEIQGEGIYASTMFLDTSDQEADQGLTLSPKIQLNDTWLFDAHDGFQDQDLDVLLGPVNFDVTIDEPQEHDLSVENLIDDQSQLLQRSPKRQKLTRALLKPIYPLIELNQSICQHEGVSAPPILAALLMHCSRHCLCAVSTFGYPALCPRPSRNSSKPMMSVKELILLLSFARSV